MCWRVQTERASRGRSSSDDHNGRVGVLSDPAAFEPRRCKRTQCPWWPRTVTSARPLHASHKGPGSLTMARVAVSGTERCTRDAAHARQFTDLIRHTEGVRRGEHGAQALTRALDLVADAGRQYAVAKAGSRSHLRFCAGGVRAPRDEAHACACDTPAGLDPFKPKPRDDRFGIRARFWMVSEPLVGDRGQHALGAAVGLCDATTPNSAASRCNQRHARRTKRPRIRTVIDAVCQARDSCVKGPLFLRVVVTSGTLAPGGKVLGQSGWRPAPTGPLAWMGRVEAVLDDDGELHGGPREVCTASPHPSPRGRRVRRAVREYSDALPVGAPRVVETNAVPGSGSLEFRGIDVSRDHAPWRGRLEPCARDSWACGTRIQEFCRHPSHERLAGLEPSTRVADVRIETPLGIQGVPGTLLRLPPPFGQERSQRYQR